MTVSQFSLHLLKKKDLVLSRKKNSVLMYSIRQTVLNFEIKSKNPSEINKKQSN